MRMKKLSLNSLRKVDFVGAALLLGGSIFIVTALQEAANGRAWSSAVIIVLLALSGPFWISFLGWEWYVTKHEVRLEPVLPWRFITNRISAGLIL